MRRRLIGSAIGVSGAVVVANGLNAIFQLALARILDPPAYSLLAALVVVAFVAAVPPIAFQASVARAVALGLAEGSSGEAGRALRSTVRGLSVWGLAVALAGLAAFPVVDVLGGNGPAALATAAAIGALLPIPAVWGGLQGARRFLALGVAQVALGATRLGAGVAVGLAGGGPAAVMGGVAVATALTFALSLVPVRDLWGAAARTGERVRRIATLGNAAAATGLTVLTALTSLDLVVARLAFDGHTAGAYAAASVGARALLLVPYGVSTVLFPRVAVLADPRRERTHLLGGLAAVALLGAVTTAVLWVFADPLVEVVFGAEYARAGDWLGPLALAMALYGLAWTYLFHFLSLGRARFALVLVGLLGAQVVAFALAHGSPRTLVAIQLVIGAVSLAAAETYHFAHARRPAS